MSARIILATLLAASLAGGGAAQPPGPMNPVGESAVSSPPLDPETWWTAPESRDERLDPLGARRAPRGAAANAAPVDASIYRLWGLMPLQTQVLRRDETVYEVWVRPADASRQAVVRATLRTDGRAFLQARAGRGCCAPGIGRRVDIDRELDAAARDRLRTLKADPVWSQPQHVLVLEEGAISAVCVDGVAYDLVRVEARRTVHLRRSCDPAEVGSVATALRTLLGAAGGFDARFDAAVKGGFGFEREAVEYAALRARGGALRGRLANTASARTIDAPAPDSVAADAADVAEGDPRAAVLATDRAFAARAQQVGTAKAFREYMDETEGKLFPTGRDPAVGAEAIYALMGGDAPDEGRLLWEPAEALVAESGELAMTWGRSRYVPNDTTQPEREGRYITLWRKDESGRWRGLWDLGNMRDVVKP